MKKIFSFSVAFFLLLSPSFITVKASSFNDFSSDLKTSLMVQGLEGTGKIVIGGEVSVTPLFQTEESYAKAVLRSNYKVKEDEEIFFGDIRLALRAFSEYENFTAFGKMKFFNQNNDSYVYLNSIRSNIPSVSFSEITKPFLNKWVYLPAEGDETWLYSEETVDEYINDIYQAIVEQMSEGGIANFSAEELEQEVNTFFEICFDIRKSETSTARKYSLRLNKGKTIEYFSQFGDTAELAMLLESVVVKGDFTFDKTLNTFTAYNFSIRADNAIPGILNKARFFIRGKYTQDAVTVPNPPKDFIELPEESSIF